MFLGEDRNLKDISGRKNCINSMKGGDDALQRSFSFQLRVRCALIRGTAIFRIQTQCVVLRSLPAGKKSDSCAALEHVCGTCSEFTERSTVSVCHQWLKL